MIELEDIKKEIDDNPTLIKNKLESGEIHLTENAKKYLNRRYYNHIHVDYRIEYSINTGIFNVNSQVLSFQDCHNITIKNKILRELNIIAYILKELNNRNKELISSVSFKCTNKKVYNILSKKQKNFNIYSKEFRLFYKISKFLKDNEIKLNVTW